MDLRLPLQLNGDVYILVSMFIKISIHNGPNNLPRIADLEKNTVGCTTKLSKLLA